MERAPVSSKRGRGGGPERGNVAGGIEYAIHVRRHRPGYAEDDVRRGPRDGEKRERVRDAGQTEREETFLERRRRFVVREEPRAVKRRRGDVPDARQKRTRRAPRDDRDDSYPERERARTPDAFAKTLAAKRRERNERTRLVRRGVKHVRDDRVERIRVCVVFVSHGLGGVQRARERPQCAIPRRAIPVEGGVSETPANRERAQNIETVPAGFEPARERERRRERPRGFEPPSSTPRGGFEHVERRKVRDARDPREDSFRFRRRRRFAGETKERAVRDDRRE